MNELRRQFAAELYATSHAFDLERPNRLERFRNLEPETAQLLGVLIRASGALRILELGTSNGYSTIWLADAAEATGGTLLSVDVDAARVALARENLGKVLLEERVELRVEDAGVTLREARDCEWDFIFLDAERPAYPGYVQDLARTLRPGGLLAVDNVRSHEHELLEFTSSIEAQQTLNQTVVPVGAGLRLAVRERSAAT